jgi:hypothetical protein
MRYYYDDPLAAAWMADKFGMRYVDGFNVSIRGDADDPVTFANYFAARLDEPDMYIHPDSLSLLELQMGDLVYIENWYDNPNSRFPYVQINIVELLERLKKEATCTIIQRNGLAFMWPKSTNDSAG